MARVGSCDESNREGNIVMYFNDTELTEMILGFQRDQNHIYWFWYRDILLEAQSRDLVRITAHTEEMPFWWRKFDESIEFTPRMQELVERNRQRNAQYGGS